MPIFLEVQAALIACMSAQPPVNYELSPEASQLATVFSEMMVFKEAERDIALFSDKQKTAFERWYQLAAPPL
jgi:hypothetical protein